MDVQITKIIAGLHEEGHTLRQIAEAVGKSETFVNIIIGLQEGKFPPKKKDDDEKKKPFPTGKTKEGEDGDDDMQDKDDDEEEKEPGDKDGDGDDDDGELEIDLKKKDKVKVNPVIENKRPANIHEAMLQVRNNMLEKIRTL